MTETTPGEGFTKIDQQPSTISDALKYLKIRLHTNYDNVHPLGETGYFLFNYFDGR
jgi:hypothetical protein